MGSRSGFQVRVCAAELLEKLPPHAVGLIGTVPEVLTPVTLEVSGKIPAWLTGALYRNGPGTFDILRKNGSVHNYSHWCDSDCWHAAHAVHLAQQ